MRMCQGMFRTNQRCQKTTQTEPRNNNNSGDQTTDRTVAKSLKLEQRSATEISDELPNRTNVRPAIGKESDQQECRPGTDQNREEAVLIFNCGRGHLSGTVRLLFL